MQIPNYVYYPKLDIDRLDFGLNQGWMNENINHTSKPTRVLVTPNKPLITCMNLIRFWRMEKLVLHYESSKKILA